MDRRFSVSDIGLTQAEAAEILKASRVAVGQQERGDKERGPLTGALELLIAVWPLLSDEQRVSVKDRIGELRKDWEEKQGVENGMK